MAKGNTGWAHPVSQSAHRMNAKLGQVRWARIALCGRINPQSKTKHVQLDLELVLDRMAKAIVADHEEFKAAYYAEHPKA